MFQNFDTTNVVILERESQLWGFDFLLPFSYVLFWLALIIFFVAYLRRHHGMFAPAESVYYKVYEWDNQIRRMATRWVFRQKAKLNGGFPLSTLTNRDLAGQYGTWEVKFLPQSAKELVFLLKPKYRDFVCMAKIESSKKGASKKKIIPLMHPVITRFRLNDSTDKASTFLLCYRPGGPTRVLSVHLRINKLDAGNWLRKWVHGVKKRISDKLESHYPEPSKWERAAAWTVLSSMVIQLIWIVSDFYHFCSHEGNPIHFVSEIPLFYHLSLIPAIIFFISMILSITRKLPLAKIVTGAFGAILRIPLEWFRDNFDAQMGDSI